MFLVYPRFAYVFTPISLKSGSRQALDDDEGDGDDVEGDDHLDEESAHVSFPFLRPGWIPRPMDRR